MFGLNIHQMFERLGPMDEKTIFLEKEVQDSLSGEEVCLDACRHGSCDPFVKTILDPARSIMKTSRSYIDN